MIPYSRKVAMPKRKAKTAGECPPPKYPKLEQGGSKHGRRNGLTTRPVKGISSNWKALSKVTLRFCGLDLHLNALSFDGLTLNAVHGSLIQKETRLVNQ